MTIPYLTAEQLALLTPEQRWWVDSLELLRLMGFPKPSTMQSNIIKNTSRVIAVSGGEQAGKSLTAAMYTAIRLPYGKLFWLVGADYEQSRAEFTYLKDALRQIEAVNPDDISMPMRGAWSMKAFSGKVHIVVKSAMDIRKLAREAPDGILMCEAAQCQYDVYLKCRGRIAPRRGFLFLSGTLESPTDWYSDIINAWQAPNKDSAAAFIIPSWENRTLYPGGENDPEIVALRNSLPDEVFKMRFGAIPTPPENLCLPEFRYGTHIPGDVQYDTKYPVQLWMDPGYSGSYFAVEVVQLIEKDAHCDMMHVHVIDELYTHNAVAGQILEACKAKPWWEGVDQIVIDVAGTQHAAMPSVAEVFQTEKDVAWQKVDVEDGILRHRSMLRDPASGKARIYFNENCNGVIGEYGKWLRKKVVGLSSSAAKPMITNCDALKAMNYGLIWNFGYVDYEPKPVKIKSPWNW